MSRSAVWRLVYDYVEERLACVEGFANKVILPDADEEETFCRLRYGLGPRHYIAGRQDIDALRAELRALASALGYEWVPEGKTAAKWERRNPCADLPAFAPKKGGRK